MHSFRDIFNLKFFTICHRREVNLNFLSVGSFRETECYSLVPRPSCLLSLARNFLASPNHTTRSQILTCISRSVERGRERLGSKLNRVLKLSLIHLVVGGQRGGNSGGEGKGAGGGGGIPREAGERGVFRKNK